MNQFFSPTITLILLLSVPILHGADDKKTTHRAMSVSAPEEDNSPEAELASFALTAGYEANLFADESDGIANPVCMNWDPAGRLWVLTTMAYPQLIPTDEPDDKLIILEDTDGDERADKTIVFADGLNMPTGFALGHGGAYVGEGSDLLHLEDTDGDDKADTRKVLFTGFGTGDTHQNINSFTWSPGGELLFCQGLHSFSRVETPWGISRLDEHGSWRLRPLRRQLHGYSRSCSGGNPWGIAFGNWGEAFIKSNGPGICELIPSMVWSDLPGIRKGNETEIGRTEIKGMILEIVDSPHLPEDIQGDLLVAGYFAHLIDRFEREIDGSGHHLVNQPPLLRSTHNACRPVDLRIGPDGALYMADWFNPIIGHYQASLRHPDRDKMHGRVWRITATGRPLAEAPDLSKATAAGLCEYLKSDWRYVRDQAKRRLADLPEEEVIPAVEAWVGTLKPDNPKLDHHLYEALGVFESHEAINGALLERLLASGDHRARAYAARVVGRWSDRLEEPLELLERCVSDENPRVRLEAIVACSDIRSASSMVVAAKAASQPMDRFIDHALTTTSRSLEPHWLPALKDGTIRFEDPGNLVFVLRASGGKDVVASVRALLGNGDLDADARTKLMLVLVESGSPTDLRWVLDNAEKNPEALDSLIESSEVRGLAPTGNLAPSLKRMLASTDLDIQVRALQLASCWKADALAGRVREVLSDPESPGALRAAAVEAHGRLRREAAIPEVVAAIDDPAPEVRRAALRTLCELDLAVAASVANGLLRKVATADEVRDLVAPFLSHKDGPGALATALKVEAIAPELASRIQGVVGSAGRFDPELDRVLRPVMGKDAVGLPEYSESYVRALSEEVKRHGDSTSGAKIYASTGVSCVACHQLGKEGGILGPELTAVGAGVPVELLIEAVLWPKRQIKEGYDATIITTKDGRTIAGYVDAEVKNRIVIRDAATSKTQTIPVRKVEARQDAGTLMPPGLTASLSRAELRDLIRFLFDQKGQEVQP